MAKEKSANPMAAHHKSEKARTLKKQKAAVTAQRNERLAHRNPQRLQTQIDELLAQKDAQGGTLRPRDADLLAKLERDVKSIRKARDAAGHDGENAAPPRRRGDDARTGTGSNGTTLGKRRRDAADRGSDSEDTEPEARDIPMPRDTPPPVPAKWLRKKNQQNQPRGGAAAPAEAPRTTYTAAPQLRDLQAEATARFVPAAVVARQKAARAAAGRGHGTKLLEPEEVDRLERGARRDAERVGEEAEKEQAHVMMETEEGAEIDLAEEERRFREELGEAEVEGLLGEEVGVGGAGKGRGVTMEEVEDEDG